MKSRSGNRFITKKISSSISEIKGIAKEDVKGRKIDWSIVSRLIGESDFILAHNAGFDRPMIESVSELNKSSQSKI